MRIIFMGTPEFGAIVLDGLVEDGYRPVLVVTAPDKPVGRKQIITPPPAKILAQKYKIPVVQPKILANYKLQITNYKPDLIVVAAYGQVLPKEILEIPKHGCLNVHPSLLPKYRGPSPIQYAILNGDKETGVTIIKMTEELDKGPIIAKKELKVEEKETSETLHSKLTELGTNLLIETIPKWLKGEIKPKPQDDSKASYTKTLRKEDGKINWRESAKIIERQIRAFNPWPGTFATFKIKNQKSKIKNIKILRADTLEQTKYGPFGPPGKTFQASGEKIAVQTGKDFLIIEELQPEGKKPMKTEEFLRGNQDFIGTILK